MSLPALRTERLVLRPFSLADAPRVQELAGAEEVATMTLTIPHPYPDGAAEEWIAGLDPAWESREKLTLAVTTAADGLVGAVGLDLRLEHRRAELGYWVGLPFWGRGFATEAAGALVDYTFRDLDLHRVSARVFPHNAASIRVVEKIGMVREGRLRHHILKWEEFRDVDCYAVLSTDRRPAPAAPPRD